MKRAARALLVVALLLLAAPSSSLGDPRTFDGGPTGLGTAWTAPENWAPDGVPTADDDVTIPSGKTAVLSGGATGLANSVTINQALQVTGVGTTLTIDGAGSSIAGSGFALTVTNGAVLNLGTDTDWSSGQIGVGGAAGGTINLGSGDVLDIFGNVNFGNTGSGGGLFKNEGTVNRNGAGATDTAVFAEPFENDGAVNVNTGRLELQAGDGAGSSSGDYAMAGGATLEMRGGHEITGIGASVSGLGTFRPSLNSLPAPLVVGGGALFDVGTLNLHSAVLQLDSNATAGTLSVTAGSTRQGAGTLSVANPLTLSSALTLNGGGTTNLNGNLTLNPGSSTFVLSVSAGHTLNLPPVSTWTSGTVGVGGAPGGTINVGSGDVLNINGTVFFGSTGSGGGVLSNQGTVNYTSAGTSEFSQPLSSSGTLNVDTGALNMPGPGLTQTGGITEIDSGATLGGPVSLQGGTLKGEGTASGAVNNSGGTVAPGASPGILTVGSYTQGVLGTLLIELNGPDVGTGFDRLAVTGVANLGGTLQVANGAGFDPAVNSAFKVLTAGTRNNQFANVTGTHPPSKLYVPRYDPSAADATPGVALVVNSNVVDTTPPDTSVTSGPTGVTNDSTPTFGFSSTEQNSTFECRIDGDPSSNTGWSACNSGTFPASALSDGAHTFFVRATDQAGNTDASAASRAFTVDTTPGVPPPTLPPAPPPTLNPGNCTNARIGTPRPDFITGTIAGDLINGLGGGDAIEAGDGDDCVNGGAGNDTVKAGAGDDRVNGNAGRDRLGGGAGKDKLSGNAGNDHLRGDGGNDRLHGGGGSDTLNGGAGKNAYSAGAGNDSLNSANGERERVNCGGGRRDRVRADREDRLRGCERVTRTG